MCKILSILCSLTLENKGQLFHIKCHSLDSASQSQTLIHLYQCWACAVLWCKTEWELWVCLVSVDAVVAAVEQQLWTHAAAVSHHQTVRCHWSSMRCSLGLHYCDRHSLWKHKSTWQDNKSYNNEEKIKTLESCIFWSCPDRRAIFGEGKYSVE